MEISKTLAMYNLFIDIKKWQRICKDQFYHNCHSNASSCSNCKHFANDCAPVTMVTIVVTTIILFDTKT